MLDCVLVMTVYCRIYQNGASVYLMCLLLMCSVVQERHSKCLTELGNNVHLVAYVRFRILIINANSRFPCPFALHIP
jgi:hypothetical protein